MKFSVVKYGMAIDLDKCTGCYSCQVSCRSNKQLAKGSEGIQLSICESGIFPHLKRDFILAVCSNCERPECVRVCNVKALELTEDGIVEYDPRKCISCHLCAEACPSGSIRIESRSGAVNKCNFCRERIIGGEAPVCVENCMGKAMIFGELNSRKSVLMQYLKENQDNLYVRREQASSGPKVFYIRRGENHFSELVKFDLSGYETDSNEDETSIKEENKKTGYINTVDMMCPAECSIKVLVRNGKAVSICGNPDSYNNRGSLCSKGASAPEFVYSRKRIRTPMVRDGERGSGKWKKVSWEYAVKEIAAKLTDIKSRYGAESVILDCGDLTDHEPYMMLFHAFGTPNTYTHSAICDTNRRWGSRAFMNDERPLPDIQRPVLLRGKDGRPLKKQEHDIKLLINVGANPLVATRFSYMSRGIPEAKISNEMYYVVIDPSFTNSASKADWWLPVKPGTDAALLACMLHYIIVNDDPCGSEFSYIDHNFLETYTEGWESFKSDFLKQGSLTDKLCGASYFSPRWGESKTGIKADDIVRLSQLMGKTKPAAIEIGMHGTAHYTDGDLTSILAVVLCAVTGNIDVPGGLVFVGSVKPKLNLPSAKIRENREAERIIGGRKVRGKISDLHKDICGDHPYAWKGALSLTPHHIMNGAEIKRGPFAGHTYPIKAFINRTGNPVYTGGNTNEWIKSFTAENKLELIVHIDTHLNETGKYADIILPECSFLEKMGISDQYTINPEISLRERVIDPMYESDTPFGIMKRLAEALYEAGDKDIDRSFISRFSSEEELLNEELKDCPSLLNAGEPLPYPQYPEGALIKGIPDDPNVFLNDKLIHKGQYVTIEWLRQNGGLAAWYMSYFRYRSRNGYPQTSSGKFRFRFRYDNTGSESAAFVWRESASAAKEDNEKYPFFLITGRTHQTGTMTQYCGGLSELETEANRILKSSVKHDKNSAVPVLLMNIDDGKKYGIIPEELIELEAENGKSVCGKAYFSEGIRPGVIKTVFGQGGRSCSSDQLMSMAEETVNVNELYDPDKINRVTGMPAFGDIRVRITGRGKNLK